MTEHERLVRAIEREASPTIALLLRRALQAPLEDRAYYQGGFSPTADGRQRGALSVRMLLEAHGVDVDELDREKRDGWAGAAAPVPPRTDDDRGR